MKKIIKKILNQCGLDVRRVRRGQQYFNTGNLTPQEENSQELYDQFYSDNRAVDDYYRSSRIRFYQAVLDEVIRRGIVMDVKRVLDMGCGLGFLVSEIKRRKKPAFIAGADFSQAAVDASKQRFPGITFFQHDITQPIPKDSPFDVIFCTEVLEHIEYPHVALRNLREGLHASGILILTVPNGRVDTLNEHLNFWSPESWRVFLERECPNARVVTGQLSLGPYNFAIVEFLG